MSARLLPPAALAAVAIAAAAAGCGESPAARSTSHASAAGSSSGGSAAPEPRHVWTQCQASDQAWVRRALLALDGRRSWGQAEVNAFEDAIQAIRAADPLPPGSAALEDGKRLVAQAMMTEDAFRERWSDFLLEALHVNRVETKNQEGCYGWPLAHAVDDGALAAYVRDGDPATAAAPPLPGFTMGQLLSSALALDDLSVVYRGNLFAMEHLPMQGANVDFAALERARRQDFGTIFGSAYLHRDLVCLSCHNSAFSVTYDPDPTKNRFFAVPGLFELALYGSSDGMHPLDEAATKGTDALRAVSMFRVADVVADDGQPPWRWSAACGAFTEPQVDDPLAIDTYFGSIQSTAAAPGKGLRASVWDLERALHRGVDLLATEGLQRGAADAIADPDEAFAYLVAENVVEKVWNEAMGAMLTIAHYFPRTAVQRDILRALTDHFVATHFSLKTLLLDIVAHPAFNLKAPDEGCGDALYEVPTIWSPWTVSEADPAQRGNSLGDGVFPISSRPLLRSLHRAMGWPFVDEYPPDDASDAFQVALGFFVKDADPGFRGLDFQGRLTWENAYGACANKNRGGDFVSRLVEQAAATPGATVGDAVAALEDRLLGEPSIDPAEKPDLEALVGGSLDATDLGGLDGKLRAVCGVLVSTPQFMLGGVAPKDTRVVPALTPPEVGYRATCVSVAGFVAASGAPYQVRCGSGTTTVTRR